MRKVGVFICHCGINIAGTVDVEQVAEEIRNYPGVAFATTYKYTCSDPGQQIIRDAIRTHQLDGVVVAACSPAMHEVTFRRAAASAGLNPYLVECANIREQCAWVHTLDRGRATEKALVTVQSMVEKVKRNEALDPLSLPLTKQALVIGGGIAGLTAALDIADSGYPVILVERSSSLGGHMAELGGTFLNFAASPGLWARHASSVLEHPNIRVLLGAEVIRADGYVGNFRVSIGHGGTYGGQEALPEIVDTGAIVVATGYDRYPLSKLSEYGGGSIPDVIDALAFEAMLGPDSPAVPHRPSDGRVPQTVVFIQCAGSRDPEHGVAYCSKVCCMVAAKQAMRFKERVPHGQAMVFYIDIRSAGLHYDEYVQRAMEQYRTLYLRGKVSKVYQEGDQVRVWGSDTLSGRAVEVAADLVVLCTPMTAAEGAPELARRLHISTDAYGFYNEAHPKLRPVESLTAGVFLAGAGQGPKDIPETVSQASAAAAKVLQLFSRDKMKAEPTIAQVIPELCAACGVCVAACPYGARQIDENDARGYGERSALPDLWRLRSGVSKQSHDRAELEHRADPLDGGRIAMTEKARDTEQAPSSLSSDGPPKVSFRQQVSSLAHEAVELCYHCHKCSGGCPVAYAMDRGPDRILRMVQLEQRAAVLASPDIWLCAGCETCGARCPNGIDIAHVMDALRQIAQAEGVRPSLPRVKLFHDIFLNIVKATGQMHEMSLLGAYKLLSGDLFSDLGAGAQLIFKGKVPIVPKLSRQRARVRRVFEASQRAK